jgi:hypothetical protein
MLLPTDYAHAAGNNYTAIRQRRVNVDCQVGTDTTQARFYFPDIPDLTNRQIVGVEAHLGNFDLSFLNSGDLNTITTSPTYTYWTANNARYCFVNFINEKKEAVYINFPAYMLYNAENSIVTQYGVKSGKIMAINTKLLFRECFIFIPYAIKGTNENFTASFTFFHL